MRDDPDGRRGSGKRKQTPSSLPFLEPVLTRQRERGSSAANSDPKPLPSDFSFDDLGIEELGTMFSSLGSGGGGAGGSLGSGGPFAGFSPRMAMSPLTGEAGGSSAASAVDEKRSSGEQQQAIIPLMRRDSAEEARSMVRAAADRGSVASSLVSSSAACADATSTAPQRSSASSSSSTASAAAMARHPAVRACAQAVLASPDADLADILSSSPVAKALIEENAVLKQAFTDRDALLRRLAGGLVPSSGRGPEAAAAPSPKIPGRCGIRGHPIPRP